MPADLRPNADLVQGDVVEVVRAHAGRRRPADHARRRARTCSPRSSEAGLIDDYRFLIAPVALGQGKAMFAQLTEPLRLQLTGTRTFSPGSVLMEYVPAP